MEEKKYQVFISSTYTDLISARTKVSEQILTMYHFPIGMEMFSAGNEDQWTVITNTIDKSDYYVIILGNRYGSLAEDGVSYTEKEYDYAKSKGIPILAFIKNRNIPTSPSERESDPEIIKKLENFIEKAKQNKMCNFWKNEDELSAQVTAALYKAFYSTPRIGWIRANTIDTTKTLEELTTLSAENRQLKDELEALKSKISSNIPKLSLSINDKDNIDLPYNPNLTYPKLDLLSPVNVDSVPEHLMELISDGEIEEYNSLIEETNEKIVEYNIQIEEFVRAQEFGVECEISIYNGGKAKATNIFVDIEFPEEVKVIEGGIGDLTSPKTPKIPKNPIKVAESKLRTNTFANSLRDFNSNFGIASLSTDMLFNRDSPMKISSNILNYNNKNYITFSDNELTVRSNSLMHTRETFYSEKFILVPKGIGDFEVNINIICEEYTEPDIQVFEIKVYDASLKV